MSKKMKFFLNKHLKNIAILNINQFIVAFSALLFSIAVTRLEGKLFYGQYLFITSTLTLFSILGAPGIKTLILRESSKERDGALIKGTVFMIKRNLLLLPLIMAFSVYYYIEKDPLLGILLFVSSFFLPILEPLNTWMPFLKAKRKFALFATLNSLKTLISAISLILAMFMNVNLTTFILLYFSINSLMNLIFYLKSKKYIENQTINTNWKKDSKYLSFMDISSVIFGKADLFIIGIFLGMDELAIYGLVMKIGDVIFKVLKSSIEAIIPKILKDKKITFNKFYQFIAISFVLPVLLFYPIKIGVALLFGSDFIEVAKLSTIYSISIPFYFINSLSNNFLLKYNLIKEMNYIKITNSLILIFLYLILIPIMGIFGGILASIIYFLTNSVSNLFVLKIKNHI